MHAVPGIYLFLVLFFFWLVLPCFVFSWMQRTNKSCRTNRNQLNISIVVIGVSFAKDSVSRDTDSTTAAPSGSPSSRPTYLIAVSLLSVSLSPSLVLVAVRKLMPVLVSISISMDGCGVPTSHHPATHRSNGWLAGWLAASPTWPAHSSRPRGAASTRPTCRGSSVARRTSCSLPSTRPTTRAWFKGIQALCVRGCVCTYTRSVCRRC